MRMNDSFPKGSNELLTKIGTGKGTNATLFTKLGRMFYIIEPESHTHQFVHQVPDYIIDAVPFFAAMIVIEYLIMLAKGKDRHRMFYAFTNITGGMIDQIFNKMIMKPVFVVLYCYIYKHYRIFELPWDSVWTWYLVFMVVDFCFYWLHRGCHEINLFWCSHQMHHSSEDFTLSTALRQSFTQPQLAPITYLPMSFFVPPSMYLIHRQFNLIYQFWVHTELVGKLGPLEYILNTPSHHRVHHGRNAYCIDKNYAGVLIIWDRMFGSFAEEKEKVAYGLVHMNTTTNPFLLQTNHFTELCKRFMRLEKWSDKWRCLFRGPDWLAECEKVGLKPEDMKIPEVEHPVIYRDVKYFNMENRLETAYVFIHFVVADLMFSEFFARRMSLTISAVYTCLAYIFFTITSLGYILEDRWFWPHMEVFRCLAMVLGDFYLTMNSVTNPVIPGILIHAVRIINVLSLLLTTYLACTRRPKTKHEEELAEKKVK